MKAKPNAIELIAEVDYWYFIIRQIEKDLNDKKPKDVISRMVDEATGHGKAMTIDAAETVRQAMSRIIDCKKLLNEHYQQGHDITQDECMLSGMEEFIKKAKADRQLSN